METLSSPISGTALVAEVAVPLPVTGPFSYAVPDDVRERVRPGCRVLVPFKNREMTGYVIELREAKDTAGLKALLSVLDEAPALAPNLLRLAARIAGYYGSGLGEAIENVLPRWVKFGKKADRMLAREKKAAQEGGVPAAEKPKDLRLTEDQAAAVAAVRRALDEGSKKPILLYGVTGSGKSEIYIRAMREVLGRGRSAICLVPEIALTEQIKRFFILHFGEDLEILHSKLSDGERFLAWKRLESGRRRIVLGPRSAVFAPLPNLGLVIIDEEHEASYKQETVPRYHAREVARWRAEAEGALLVLGSATPSLESMRQAEQGLIERVDLASRIDRRAMPFVEVLDLKDLRQENRRPGILSARLLVEIEDNLRRREGTLLLLNRRGFSTHIHCLRCGHVEACGSCQVSLTYHQERDILVCHYCNYQKKAGPQCPSCKGSMLKFAGFGTEKIESEVARHFPAARLARMDSDTVRRKGAHEDILSDFRAEKTDILIGTQMIAKGFDFPHVTLVGVVLADVGLVLPDFRSAERTFQLLTQVAGRAGRGEKPGRVFIQTYSPEHSSIRFAKEHDYLSFYAHETRERAVFRYPPYSQLVNLIVRSRDEKKAYAFARSLRERLAGALIPQTGGAAEKKTNVSEGLEIMGPAPLPFYKLRGHFRWHVMLKADPVLGLPARLAGILAGVKKVAHVAMAVDVDPVNIL